MSFFKEIQCKTAEELMDKLSPRHELWMNRNYPQYSIEPAWIFRGQGNAKWGLTPAAWRKSKRSTSFIEERTKKTKDVNTDSLHTQLTNYKRGNINNNFRFVNRFSNIDESRIIDAVINALIEFRNIGEFIDLSNSLGLHVPSFGDVTRLKESFVSYYFNHLLLGERPQFWESDAVALAQHHGVPTRLLDWTYSAYKAAYFAASKHHRRGKLAIFGLYLPMLKSGGNVIRLIHVESRNNDFLRAQEALFTLDSSADDLFLRNGEYPTLEETLTQNKYGQTWTGTCGYKFTLPASESLNLLLLLRVERIHLASLMPTYDNVAQQIYFDWIIGS